MRISKFSTYLTRTNKLNASEYDISPVFINKLKKIYNKFIFEGSNIEYNNYPQYTRDNPLINIVRFKKD